MEPVSKVGRPTKLTEALGDRICDHRAEGLSKRQIAEKPGMPSSRSMCLWLRENPEFSRKYSDATRTWLHTMIDEVLEIADDPSIPVAVQRLRINARKWQVGRLLPKRG